MDLTEPAQAEITEAGENMRYYQSEEVAEEFGYRVAEAFRDEATRLAEEIEQNETSKLFDTPDEAASIVWAKPVYRLRIETAKRRGRGKSTGLWYAYYALRHSAARLITLDVSVV